MELGVPNTSLIVLCGAAGCGKSTFAAKNFKPTEIVSSDRCRALVSDDEENMVASKEAFELFYFIIQKRMKLGKLVVADSTALSYDARKKLLELGSNNNYYVMLVAFDVPLNKALERNNMRFRKVSDKVIEKQYNAFRRSLKYIRKEGFDEVVILKDDEIDNFYCKTVASNITVCDSGPFDVISDVHGCCSELEMLLEKIGYVKRNGLYEHPDKRKVVFAGDIVDRGPRIADTINTVIKMVASGNAYYIPGNHCNKFYRYLMGNKVQIKNGLEVSAVEYEKYDKTSGSRLKDDFIHLYENAPPYLILDNGNLVVAHAGIKEDMIGKISKKIKDFVLYGDITGELDQERFQDRGNWASDYHGNSLIVYGHTPTTEPELINNTININQGVSIGGSLTAFRYPEKVATSVKSIYTYYDRERNGDDRDINLENFLEPLYFKSEDGYRVKLLCDEVKESTGFLNNNLELLPWVIYVPPIIPCLSDNNIEQQAIEACRYYKNRGMHRIICESVKSYNTIVVILCKSTAASKNYFSGPEKGEIYSIFNKLPFDKGEKHQIISRLSNEFEGAGYFEHYNTDFIVIEALAFKDENIVEITPRKIVAHSGISLLNKDNIWHMENLDKLCENSVIFSKYKASVIQNESEIISVIENAAAEGYRNIIIKPVKSLPHYKYHLLQPEIMCSNAPTCIGAEYFRLSTLANELANIGVEKFLKKKFSKKYFEFIIGCVTINNRMLKMRV